MEWLTQTRFVIWLDAIVADSSPVESLVILFAGSIVIGGIFVGVLSLLLWFSGRPGRSRE